MPCSQLLLKVAAELSDAEHVGGHVVIGRRLIEAGTDLVAGTPARCWAIAGQGEQTGGELVQDGDRRGVARERDDASGRVRVSEKMALAAFRLEVARLLREQGLSRKEDLTISTDTLGARRYRLPDPPTWVVSVRKDRYDVYIGRPMPGFRAVGVGWGNPFRGPNAIAKYRQWIETQPKLLARLPELRGKRLGCWCAPKGGIGGNLDGHICHGEVLAALADALHLGADSDSGSQSGGDAA